MMPTSASMQLAIKYASRLKRIMLAQRLQEVGGSLFSIDDNRHRDVPLAFLLRLRLNLSLGNMVI